MLKTKKLCLMALVIGCCAVTIVFVTREWENERHLEPRTGTQEVLSLLSESMCALKVGVDERMVLALFGEPTLFVCMDGEKIIYQGVTPPPVKIKEKVNATQWLYVYSALDRMKGMRIVTIENGIVSVMGYKYEGMPVNEKRDFVEVKGLERGDTWRDVVELLGVPQIVTIATALERDGIEIRFTYKSEDFAELTISGGVQCINNIEVRRGYFN